MRPLVKKEATPVNEETAKAIEALRAALTKEFKWDYAFTIMGRGHLIGAANSKDGEVIAKAR